MRLSRGLARVGLRATVALGFVFSACTEPQLAGLPIDTMSVDTSIVRPDSTTRADTLRAVERFGRYHAEIYVPPAVVTPPSSTPDGPFTTVATSTSGHRVGLVQNRYAIWIAGDPAPSYMFRADTNTSGLFAWRINDRLEAVFTNWSGGTGSALYFWRAGTLKRVTNLHLCFEVGSLNNRGYIVYTGACNTYNYSSILPSPFSPDPIVGKFVGNKCGAGRQSFAGALNDSSEYLHFAEVSVPITHLVWRSGGCRDLTATFPGFSFSVLGDNGLVAGATNDLFPVAVLTDATAVAAVDDLLDDPRAQPVWHVVSVTQMRADRTIIAQAIRIADNRTFTVKLTRIAP